MRSMPIGLHRRFGVVRQRAGDTADFSVRLPGEQPLPVPFLPQPGNGEGEQRQRAALALILEHLSPALRPRTSSRAAPPAGPGRGEAFAGHLERCEFGRTGSSGSCDWQR